MARSSLGNIKKALMESMEIARNPLTTGQAFMCHHQGTGEAVRDYVLDLKKLLRSLTLMSHQIHPSFYKDF